MLFAVLGYIRHTQDKPFIFKTYLYLVFVVLQLVAAGLAIASAIIWMSDVKSWIINQPVNGEADPFVEYLEANQGVAKDLVHNCSILSSISFEEGSEMDAVVGYWRNDLLGCVTGGNTYLQLGPIMAMVAGIFDILIFTIR